MKDISMDYKLNIEVGTWDNKNDFRRTLFIKSQIRPLLVFKEESGDAHKEIGKNEEKWWLIRQNNQPILVVWRRIGWSNYLSSRGRSFVKLYKLSPLDKNIIREIHS